MDSPSTSLSKKNKKSRFLRSVTFQPPGRGPKVVSDRAENAVGRRKIPNRIFLALWPGPYAILRECTWRKTMFYSKMALLWGFIAPTPFELGSQNFMWTVFNSLLTIFSSLVKIRGLFFFIPPKCRFFNFRHFLYPYKSFLLCSYPENDTKYTYTSCLTSLPFHFISSWKKFFFNQYQQCILIVTYVLQKQKWRVNSSKAP